MKGGVTKDAIRCPQTHFIEGVNRPGCANFVEEIGRVMTIVAIDTVKSVFFVPQGISSMRIKSASAIFLIVTLCFANAASGDTTISYQGRLDSGGQPHTGMVGMVFELFDQASGGDRQGPVVHESVQLTDGLFQVDLDFGLQPYAIGRWLQVTVNGQVLNPRQRVSGAPFALATPEVPWRVVGSPEEPAFGGVHCQWTNLPPNSDLVGASAAPTSFFKDAQGMVHLRGFPVVVDAEGNCMEIFEPLDSVIFVLPDGYAPEYLKILTSQAFHATQTRILMIAPAQGIVTPEGELPGGAVMGIIMEMGPGLEGGSSLDGISFRAAPDQSGQAQARKPLEMSLEELSDPLFMRSAVTRGTD